MALATIPSVLPTTSELRTRFEQAGLAIMKIACNWNAPLSPDEIVNQGCLQGMQTRSVLYAERIFTGDPPPSLLGLPDVSARRATIVSIGEQCDAMPWRGASGPLLTTMRGLKGTIFEGLRATCPIYREALVVATKTFGIVVGDGDGHTSPACMCAMCTLLTRTTFRNDGNGHPITADGTTYRCTIPIDRGAMAYLPLPGVMFERGFHATSEENARKIIAGGGDILPGRPSINTPASLATGKHTFFALAPNFVLAYTRGPGARTDRGWAVAFEVVCPLGEAEAWDRTRQDYVPPPGYNEFGPTVVQRRYKGALPVVALVLFPAGC